MLITEEYRRLNRELHAGGNYGIGGHRWARIVERLRKMHGCDTVLDYGCGKGKLGEALGRPDWLKEYDPAVPGKDAPPARADLVVCTDVLEHVEPECLDDVLADLRDKAKKVLLCNIATREAVKHLPDGRNAHLNVHDADWWHERLDPYFRIDEWEVTENDLTVVAHRQVAIGELFTKSAVTKEIRGEQMRLNLPRVKARLAFSPPHGRTAILCCFGPSLADTWREARDRREAGNARIATVSGAHDYLIGRGVVPDYHMECDPREHKAIYTANPHRDVRYLVAACVHPKMIDQLIDHDLRLWFAATGEEDFDLQNELEPGSFAVAGGGSIGLRALNVLYVMGYRRFVIHGMDCSFTEDGSQHAAFHAGKKMTESPVRIGDRWFRSSMSMVSYARFFFKNVDLMSQQARRDGEPDIEGLGSPCSFELAGDGLLQEMARDSLRRNGRAA